MNPFKPALAKLWWISLFVKLVISAVLPLSSDEAYYWVWSKNLQLSYYDHPGMIAWLLKIGNIFEGFGNAIRWPIVLLGHLSLLIWIRILDNLSCRGAASRPCEKKEAPSVWLWLVLCSPLLGFGSIIATPDVPVVFFWSLATYAFIEIDSRVSRTTSGRHWYVLLGISLGLGFCSKYHIVIFPFLMVLYILIERKWALLRLGPMGLTILFGLVFSLPVLIWNFQHDFISFKFQIKHGLGRNSWKPFWTYSYLMGQILAIFPIVFWAALRAKVSGKNRFLIYTAWGPLLFFFISSFKGKVEMNWPIVAIPAVFALAAMNKKLYNSYKYINSFWLVLILIFTTNLFIPFLKETPTKLQEPIYYQSLKDLPKKYSPLFAGTYQMAAQLWYMNKSPIFKLNKMSREDFFDHLEGARPKTDRFYLVADLDHSFPDWMSGLSYSINLLEEIDSKFVLFEVIKK